MPNDEEILGLAATTTTEVSTLIHDDVYSSLILEALYAARAFAGIVSATREDLTAEAGNDVQVPYMSARTAQGPIAEGVALTANASATGTYAITIEKFGDYDLVNREVFEDQTIFDENAFLRNQAEALAEKVDDLVWTELETAAAASSETLAVAGTLTDLYDQVVELKAKMKKLKVKPNFLITGPDQEAQFLKDTSEGIKLQQIQVRDGELMSVAGLPVIISPLCNANAATAGLVQAVMIDSRRAVGEAWGRRPERVVDRVTKADSDQVRLITWLRYGTDELDVNAIGHVKNP
jgi:hypothetical protein